MAENVTCPTCHATLKPCGRDRALCTTCNAFLAHDGGAWRVTVSLSSSVLRHPSGVKRRPRAWSKAGTALKTVATIDQG